MANLRRAIRERVNRLPGNRTAEGASTGGRGLLTSLLVAGAVVAVYLAVRRLGARGRGRQAGDRSTTEGDGRRREIPIGGDTGGRAPRGTTTGTDREGDRAGESRDRPDESRDRASESRDRTDEGMPGVDRSSEEIAERAEADAHEQPAEPGEMTVDEDVAEEAMDAGGADEDVEGDADDEQQSADREAGDESADDDQEGGDGNSG